MINIYKIRIYYLRDDNKEVLRTKWISSYEFSQVPIEWCNELFVLDKGGDPGYDFYIMWEI